MQSKKITEDIWDTEDKMQNAKQPNCITDSETIALQGMRGKKLT